MPVQNIPDSLCLRVHEPNRVQGSQFDVFLCYRGGSQDCELARKLRDRLTSCYVERRGYARRPLTVFLETGPTPPTANEQVASALHHSSLVILLVSRSTFADIDGLQKDSSENNRLVQLLWQYEMALELCEFGQCKVVPLLAGRQTNKFGSTEYENFDECEEHDEYWRTQAPEFTVKSILEDALEGLRCRAEVATRLDDHILQSVGGIPSIIHGRTVKQTINALSSRKIFTPWKLVGSEGHAFDIMCTKVTELAERASRQSHPHAHTLEGEGSNVAFVSNINSSKKRRAETGEGQQDMLCKRDSSTQHDDGENSSSVLKCQRLLASSGSSSSYGCHSGDGGSTKTLHDGDCLLGNGGGVTAADKRETGLRRVFLGYRVDKGVILIFFFRI